MVIAARKVHMKRSMLMVGCVCATACLLAGCPKGPQGEGGGGGMMGGSAPPVPVFLEPVVMQDYASAVTLVGEVRAAQRAVLTAEASGAITRIAHRVGEKHPGSSGTLIQIDPANYEIALEGAQAQLAQAKERLRMAQAGPRAQEIAAQEAQVAAPRPKLIRLLTTSPVSASYTLRE